MNEFWTEITVRVRRRDADVVSLALIEAGAGGVEVEDPASQPPPGVEVRVDGRPEQEVESLAGADGRSRAAAGGAVRTEEEPDDLLTLKAIYPPERGEEPERQARQELSRLRSLAGEAGANDAGGSHGGSGGRRGRAAPVFDIGVAQIPPEDWEQAWKSGFHTIKVTPRLVIRPSWEEHQSAAGEKVVTIDPGLAFGTGSHPTTLLCLRLLDQVVLAGDEILDAGTGSAILAVAAVRLGAARVLGVDADPLAIKAARRNIDLNGAGDRVTVQLSDIATVLPRAAGVAGLERSRTWDGICFNISTDFILAHLGAMFRQSGRWTIISGYPEHRRDEVITGLARAGWPEGAITDIIQDGWGAVLARKHPTGPVTRGEAGPRPGPKTP